jgi:hypothetical protein
MSLHTVVGICRTYEPLDNLYQERIFVGNVHDSIQTRTNFTRERKWVRGGSERSQRYPPSAHILPFGPKTPHLTNLELVHVPYSQVNMDRKNFDLSSCTDARGIQDGRGHRSRSLVSCLFTLINDPLPGRFSSGFWNRPTNFDGRQPAVRIPHSDSFESWRAQDRQVVERHALRIFALRTWLAVGRVQKSCMELESKVVSMHIDDVWPGKRSPSVLSCHLQLVLPP